MATFPSETFPSETFPRPLFPSDTLDAFTFDFMVLYFQRPASKTLVIDKDVTGYTPVHYAARGGYLQVYIRIIPRTCVEYELINKQRGE